MKNVREYIAKPHAIKVPFERVDIHILTHVMVEIIYDASTKYSQITKQL